ncbi:hypothetical protein IPZ68_05390 [Streptomyces arenae]|nr:hypothetical protein [Streptomyces arenae]
MRHVATENPFVVKARASGLTDDDVASVVRLENATLDNVTACIALAAARFRNTGTMDFLLEIGQLVGTDRDNVRAAAIAYKTPLEEYPGQRLAPVAYTYPSFINWICLHGTPAAIGLVCYADITLWHEACVILTPALRAHPGLPKEVVDYFASYEERPDEVLDKSLAVVEASMTSGADLRRAADTARLMEDHLAAFWRAAAQ